MRQRLVVIAPTTADVVNAAGGWLFDRVMAGWDALVLVGDDADRRPFQILGVRAVDLDAALTSPVHGPQPHALAVARELYDTDLRVRELVRQSVEEGATEVRLWGEAPAGSGEEAGSVRHRLSIAARAFKARALAAAAAAAAVSEVSEVGVTEVFRHGGAPVVGL